VIALITLNQSIAEGNDSFVRKKDAIKKDPKAASGKKKKDEQKFKFNHPGLYDTYKLIVKENEQALKLKANRVKERERIRIDLKKFKNMKYDPEFFINVLLKSSTKFSNLIINDPCSFYDLIINDQINSSLSKEKEFLVNYPNKKYKLITTIIPKKDLLENALATTCQYSKYIQQDLEPKNIARILPQLPLQIPVSQDMCMDLHAQLSSLAEIPYLCKIQKNIDNIEKIRSRALFSKNNSLENRKSLALLQSNTELYKKVITGSQRNYIKKICKDLNSPKLFCASFFRANFWSKIQTGDIDHPYIKYACRDILKKENFDKNGRELCIQKMNENPELCHFINPRYESLTPKPSCSKISRSLNYSRLRTNYKDCPGLTGNEGVVNIARVLKHYKNENTLKYNGLCSMESAATFVDFNLKFDNEAAWDVGLCFKSPATLKDRCLPSLFGVYPGSKYSVEKTIKTILENTRGFDPSMKCKEVPKEIYNPNVLKFKSGCFLVYDPLSCTATDCKPRIYLNSREITSIKSKSNLEFDYFENSYKNTNYNQHAIFKRELKKRDKVVMNLNILLYYLNKNVTNIVHGVGCAEDLLPSFFKKSAFSKCSPLPFIIDGSIKDKEKVSLIIRTAIDDVHAPRVIDWNFVFSAVKAYQIHHPQKRWSLYAIH
jgi:hypothetical protein